MPRPGGHETQFGRHMIPGAPLDWLWNHRGEGFRVPDSKKPADEILREGKWDVLILQPYGRAPEKSIEFGANYAAAAYQGNPDCRVYVFANYPGLCEDLHEYEAKVVLTNWAKTVALSEEERRVLLRTLGCQGFAM